MPIPVPIPYATFPKRQDQEAILRPLVDGRPCDAPGCAGKMRLSSTTVERGLTRLRRRKFVYGQIGVLLARCDGRKRGHTRRVLPADVLPRKTFALGAQEAPLGAYVQPPSRRGLRKTLSRFSGAVPHPSTLWRWSREIGLYVLGRYTPPGVLPVGALLEATRRRLLRREPLHVSPQAVHPDRYRSEERKEELEAAAGFLVLAGDLFRLATREAFPAWRGLILKTDRVAAVGWWTTNRFSSMQQRVRDAPG